MAEIIVAGKRVQVDDDVLPALGNYYLSLVGRGYVRCSLKGWENRGKGFYLHRMIMDVHKEKGTRFVDHINRDKLDNRKENLRLIEPRDNSLNRDAKRYWFEQKRNRWVVEFYIHKKRYRFMAKSEETAKEMVGSLRKLSQLPTPHK